jgi:hypothetical protein
MGFQPGHSKVGGRKKGTPNKATQELEAICEKHGLNVFEAMVVLASNEDDPDKKFERLKDIAPYLYAKRSSNETVLIDETEEQFEKLPPNKKAEFLEQAAKKYREEAALAVPAQ